MVARYIATVHGQLMAVAGIVQAEMLAAAAHKSWQLKKGAFQGVDMVANHLSKARSSVVVVLALWGAEATEGLISYVNYRSGSLVAGVEEWTGMARAQVVELPLRQESHVWM